MRTGSFFSVICLRPMVPTIFSPIVGVLSALSLDFIVQFLAFISFFSLIVQLHTFDIRRMQLQLR